MKDIQRMCFICRNCFYKKDLIRLVKNSKGEIFIDSTGKANGRGAYFCKNTECLNQIKRPKVLNKAFKTEFPENVYLKLCEELFGKNN